MLDKKGLRRLILILILTLTLAKKGSDGDSHVMDLLKSFLTKEGLTVAELRQELARRRDVAISRALGLEMVSCLLEMVGHGMARARRAREPPPCLLACGSCGVGSVWG